jgi:hypothetical protein
MSPLFACSGCGVQIERSARLYRQQKGRVLCSSCKDRLEAVPARGLGRGGERQGSDQKLVDAAAARAQEAATD